MYKQYDIWVCLDLDSQNYCEVSEVFFFEFVGDTIRLYLYKQDRSLGVSEERYAQNGQVNR